MDSNSPGPAVTSRGAKMPQWGIFRARLANPPAPTKRLWQKCCHSLFSLLYRRKSASLSADFQSAFYSVVQPFSDGWAFLFADSDRLPSPLRSDFQLFSRKFSIFYVVFRMFSISPWPISRWLRKFFVFADSFQFVFKFSIFYLYIIKEARLSNEYYYRHINTSTMNSEMILTVLSAFAQAESESISQNVARGKRMGFKQGKFPFPYGQMLGYRKGAGGKPEIIPEQAEVIRLIYNSYLQGYSLQNIKKKLETAGAVTARGNATWSSQAILRILQNEKYCGDVLLQKTFTEGVLTGTQKKNTGQLPQYYIENHHEGIVTKQMFREVQAEIAKRQSKDPANIRKKRKGRYNSKYALSGRLVCGECGSRYKRVTWDIHGRKEVVWRCASRTAYGTKFCKHSPSIPEEELHEAILKAIQELADNFTAEVSAQLNGILQQIEQGENTDTSLQTQLEQAQQEFDRLLELSLDLDEQTPFLDNKLKQTNEKIKALKRTIAEGAKKKKQTPPQLRIAEKDLQIKEYDDTLTARIVEKIVAHSRQEVEIEFIGGYKEKKMLN